MRRSLVLLLAAAALVAAGCGSNGSSSTSTGSSAPASTGSSGSSGGGGAVTVDMKNIQFEPKDITVNQGQTITWKNLDTVDHDVVAQSGATFKSDQFGNGGTFKFTADKAGKIDYVCTLHPGMTGTITVR
ncbi:cupredoxin domain-containing protein [Capillimicrobium parvum]|uniref:Amicyanin n=1 Tax=Capillimicrobium parvum TaxID=2884022 RepID=A0A9E7BYX1_9ACTN|nr:plastocyanin/azurin family copper-binding protein [Capillimicrobium parvum]UGS33944.1 Amicyanin [Capillimicrobium parvum]